MMQTNDNLNLDMQEQRIIKRAEIPRLFALFLKEKSLLLGVAFALRVSPSSHRYLMPASPKPLSVKAKTGNWGFAKGVISIDPLLGFIEMKNGKWEVLARHLKDIPQDKELLQPVLHKLSLQEVLSGLHIGEYELVGTEQQIQQGGRIRVKAHKQPTDADIIFSIDLTEKKPRVEPQCPIDFQKILARLPAKETRPDWWNDAWGIFDNCLSHYYPAQYQQAGDSHFSDIFVYGVQDENGTVLPITGDQDLLWISTPTQSSNGDMQDFSEILNTLEPGGIEKLYLARLNLHFRLGGSEEDAEQSISNSSIAGLGCVTAYESYVIDEVNKSFANSGINHLRNLIQHAAENHNPNEPSQLDARMVHIWEGKISVTHDEHELIQFFTQPGFPNQNKIDIHPRWDMSKWAAAIYQQLVLKQPVLADTLAAYKAYRQKTRHNIFGFRPSESKNVKLNDKGDKHE